MKPYFLAVYAILALFMSDYILKPVMLPSRIAQATKEKRKKVLDGVRARRKIIYQRYKEKHQELPHQWE